MSLNPHKECFGKMFPESLHLLKNKPNEGKVFSVRMKQLTGGMLPTNIDRSIKTDIKQWENCNQCPEFESCYKLGLAKVTLESALAPQ